MKKNTPYANLLKSRITIAVCLIFVFLFSGVVHANDNLLAQTVTAKFRNVSLNEVIWELQKQTDFTFIYSTNDVKDIKVKNLSVDNEMVTEVLDRCLEDSGLTYTVHNGVVAIKKAEVIEALTIMSPAPEQKVAVTGQVLDSLGEPMPGVNVLVKETRQGAITDLDGRFNIEVAQGQKVTLQFSFIGFVTQEVAVTQGKPVNVTMQDDTNVLDEVVVTGYGTFKKSAYAGSASTVRTQGMEEIPAVGFATLLQGSAPGVQVSSISGQPGTTTDIQIRGMGSFNASTNPLYVIDGVPVISGNIGTKFTDDIGTDAMSTINTSDIESITVIKDAAAASLYGSRAANGVIIITTKSGKEGKPTFNFKADWGFSKFSTKFRETLSGPERREIFYEGYYNQAIEKLKYTSQEAEAYAREKIEENAFEPWSGWTDWNKVLFRDSAPFQNYEFSASGGDNKLSYFTSLAYTDQDGLSYQQNFERISGRVNVRYQMSPKLQLGANILYSNVNQSVNSEGGTYTSPIYSSRHKVSPSDAVYNEDGTYNQDLLSNSHRNPKMAADMNYKRQKVDRSFNTIFANYKIINDLLFNTTFSLDHTNTRYKSWDDPKSSDGASSNGEVSSSFYQYDQIVWKNSLNYTKTFAQKHNLDALIGYETNEYKRDYLSGTMRDFPSSEKQEISNGSLKYSLGGSERAWRLLSYLSRINYNYNDKYFFGVSARMDGSNRLHKDNRWGTFWSLSGAWRMSEENFMKPLEPVLSEVKLRASYGSNGTLPNDTDEAGIYRYIDLVGFGYKYNEKPGIIEYQIGNKDLTWEKNYNFNIGLDFRLFNRVNATIEYYTRQTSDLLMDYKLSRATGFNDLVRNIGKVQNRGIEAEFNADILRTKDWLWNSSLNFSHNKNKIKDLGGLDEIKSGAYTHRVGHPYWSFYVVEFAGINPETGVPQFYVNDPKKPGDREITETASKANYILYKNAEPDLVGGWSNMFKYKFIDLNFTFTYSLGGYSYDRGAGKLETGGNNPEDNVQALYKDRWKKPGDKTTIEKFMVGNDYDMSKVTSSRRLHSTDHIRLKNITLGVSIPKNIIKPLGLTNVRAYCSAVNLLTWAKYDGYDPEVSGKGEVYFESPKLKTITFGIDIKF